MFRAIAVKLLVIVGLLIAIETNANAVDLQVYKGELRLIVPGQKADDSLLIRYRSKTREVVRIGINELVLTNTTTNQVIKLNDKSASLSNRYDQEGYWNTDIGYGDLTLGDDNYRIAGRLTLYLHGSQRTRSFSVYLKPESGNKPHDSTIDWGVDN